MTRKQSRDLAFKLIYQMGIQKEEPDVILEICFEENTIDEKSKEYIEKAVKGVAQNIAEIDEHIKNNSEGWNINRISRLAISALRLAIFEILYCDDIPDTVAINEAVDLTKLYEGEEAAGFVNGILATVLKTKGTN